MYVSEETKAFIDAAADCMNEKRIVAVLSCLPEKAVKGGEGEKSISFNDIVAHLTKAVQELSARIEMLESQH